MRNSTIRQKTGSCEVCGRSGPLTKKMCPNCYWQGIRLKSVNKQNDKEEERAVRDGLMDLIEKADAVFSRYIRLKAANGEDYYPCFICGTPTPISEGQNMHYIKRSNIFLRHDQRNCFPGCANCNVVKGGNYTLFSKRIEEMHPGLTSLLMEESTIVYKPSKEEIRAIINEYRLKLKQLK